MLTQCMLSGKFRRTAVFFFMALVALCSGFCSLPVQAQIDLGWEQLDTPELPPSIKAYKSTATLPDGSAVQAWYTIIDLNDPNVEIDVAYPGLENTNLTPVEEMNNSEEPVYVATNGTFYNTTTYASVCPIVDDGKILILPLQTATSDGVTYYPTRGLWGMNSDRESQVVWAFGSTDDNQIFAYEEPYPNSLLEDPLPMPTLDPAQDYAPDGRAIPTGYVYEPAEAMGSYGVLIKNGEVLDYDSTDTDNCAQDLNCHYCNELLGTNLSFTRHPRTAIGTTMDRKHIILLVVDGRSVNSVGATLEELAEIMEGIGAYDALNLDGGGSTSITVNNFDGVLEAPSTGNGDNSSDVLNTPSDGYMRSVSNSILIKRRPLYFDADTDQSYYTEEGDGWFPTGNSGSYPDDDSPTRLVATVGTDAQGTATASFALEGIVPAEYELSAYWVGAPNRADNAPFTIERNGFDSTIVRMDQTDADTQFNKIGTYHLSADDIVKITNNADNDYVAIDALRLRYVGESTPTVTLGSSSTMAAIQSQKIQQSVTISSPNSAVFPTKINVYKSVDEGEETLFDSVDFSGTSLTETYTLDYEVTETQNSTVTFRFEVKDNHRHTVMTSMDINVMAFSLTFDPEDLDSSMESGDSLAFNINLDTGSPEVTMTRLTVYVSRNGGDQEIYQSYDLSASSETIAFSYLAEDEAGNELTFTFVGTSSDGSQSETTYTVAIEPAKGDFTIGFISDMNGSFGSTTYDSYVQEAVALFVSQGVDLVISAGDMVAGQCSTASTCDEAAMWEGFDTAIYSQLKDAGIPFLFTLQNHDAGNSWDLSAAIEFWTDTDNVPQGTTLTMVDDTDYPKNYSAVLDFDGDGTYDIFFVSVFNPGDDLDEDELAFLDATLQSEEAKSARLRIVDTGQPLYAVSNPRNSAGYVTGPRDEITQILRDRNVDLFVSGDSAAYFPGKRFDIKMLSLAEMGGTGKAYIGEDQVPPTAVTCANIFKNDDYYGENAIVLTTYDILNDFDIVRKETLPKTLIGFDDEFIIRDDTPITNSGATELSSMNLTEPFASTAAGSATMIVGDDTVTIQGSFSGLGASLLSSFDAIGLYRGRNGEDGELVQTLDVKTTNALSGTFSASYARTTETLDALAAGLYYIQINTADLPTGALRGQLYNTETSNAPESITFTNTDSGDTVSVRNVSALLIVEWTTAEDKEKSPVTYTYQLSTSADFSEGSLLVNAYVGTNNYYQGMTEAQWLALLDGSSEKVLYQRIIASDGQTIVIGQAQEIKLTENSNPVEGEVTVEAPNFQYQGIFATLGTGFTVYDIAIDETTGRIWANNYYHGPYCFNTDGTIHKFSDSGIGYGTDANGNDFINAIDFNGNTFSDGYCYGVEYDPDGYILVVTDGNLFKLDAYTGKPVAFWDSPTSIGSNPSMADDKSVFMSNVYPGNAAYIVKPSSTVQGEYDIVTDFGTSLAVSGSVTRTSAYSPEGDRIYLVPTSSSPYVSVYARVDGEWVRQDNFEMPASTGSDAVYAGENQTMWVINEKSTNPPNLIYVDFTNQETWNLYLEDIEESDIRAMTVSRDGKTVYVGGSTAIYKYQVVEEGTQEDPSLISLSQATALDDDDSAQLLGETVRVQAVVTTSNLAADGLEFYGEDAGDQVKFFAGTVVDGYTPKAGDLVEVKGQVLETLGQVYIQPESIELVSQDQPLARRPLVTEIGEDQESQVVIIPGISLTDADQWTNDGFFGFEVTAAKEDGYSFNLFISKGTDIFGNEAPEGTFTVTGVVQQKGDEYIVTPLSTMDIGLEGQVSTAMMTKYLPATSNRVTFRATAARSLGRVKTSAYSWYRNGFQVDSDNDWETVTGRFYACRNLNYGDVLVAHVTTADSVYPYASIPFALGMAPELSADITDNAPGETITITFDENQKWAAAIEKIVLVSGDQEILISQMGGEGELQGQEAENLAQKSVEVDSAQYTVNTTGIVFSAETFDQVGTYTVMVYADGYRLNTVDQEILTASPTVETDNEDNDLLNDIVITFEPDEDWAAAVTGVFINGTALEAGDYTIENGQLIIYAGVFPGAGTLTVTVEADGYTDRTFEQTIVLSTPPALTADTTDNVVGQAIEIEFEANAIWQGYITEVLVNESPLSSDDYTIDNGVLTLVPGVLGQVREYVITVSADNFDDTEVAQPVLAATVPELIPAEDVSIFDDVVITFEDNAAWRSTVLSVIVDGEALDSSAWTLNQGNLVIAAGTFSEAGDYEIQVTAGVAYQVATVTQTINAPEYTVSGTVTMDGSALASVDIILDQLLEMDFEGNLNDTSGNGNEANSANVPVYDDDADQGQILDFDGSSDLVNLPDFVLEGDYSISLWLNPDVIEGTQGTGSYSRSFMAYYEDSDNAFRFTIENGYIIASIISGGEEVGVGTPSGSLTADQWVHVTIVVKKGKQARVYLGGQDQTDSSYAWSRGTDAGLTLGARNSGGGHFDGQMDSLMIWNRALTAEEVSDLASTGKGPRVVTGTDGTYTAQVYYGKDLILKPEFSGVTFTPEMAGFTNIQADITQNFTGEGEVSLAVPNPIANMSVDTSSDLVIDLSAMMADPSDPQAQVSYTLVSNSDSDFINAVISGTELTLSFKEVYGKASIEIKGTANGKEGSDSFIVELNPYCEAGGGGDWEYIFEVNLIGSDDTDLMTNESGQTQYSNYRYSSITQVTAGETITLRVSSKDWSSDEVLAWIDWNQDGDFEDDGETYTVGTGWGTETLGTYLHAWSYDITVPETAKTGKTMLRIRHHDASASGANTTPCGSSSYGEVEDYGLDIQAAAGTDDTQVEAASSASTTKSRAKAVKKKR